jgi:hypothetical protein
MAPKITQSSSMLLPGLTTHFRQSIRSADPVPFSDGFGMTPSNTSRTFAGWQPFHAPVALWLLCCGLAAGLNQFVPGPAGREAAIAAVVAGAVIALRLTEIDVPRRVLLVLSMLPALLPESVGPLGWIAGGGLMAIVAARGHVLSIHTNDLHRHLSWCRRRGEDAAVLAATVPSDQVSDPSRIVASFRITDSVSVHRRGRSFEIAVVLDQRDLRRDVVERRLVEAVGPARVGWASFPENGVALVALLESAADSARLIHPPTEATEPVAAPIGASFDVPRAALGAAED